MSYDGIGAEAGSSTGVHTDVCRQLLETGKGMLELRRKLVESDVVDWLGVETCLGRMKSMGTIAWSTKEEKVRIKATQEPFDNLLLHSLDPSSSDVRRCDAEIAATFCSL